MKNFKEFYSKMKNKRKQKYGNFKNSYNNNIKKADDKNNEKN